MDGDNVSVNGRSWTIVVPENKWQYKEASGSLSIFDIEVALPIEYS